jgi:hypothetical protein
MYPQAWRERYEEEMMALLELHTVTLATHFDLLLGALDARLNPAYRSTNSFFLFKDARMVMTTFLCAYAIFLFAMYNWHHYIPLSLSLTPYYIDMAIRSTPNNVLPFVELQKMSGDAMLTMSDWVMQVTLLACNFYFIILFMKQADGAERKRFLLLGACCLILLLVLPLLPLLSVDVPRVTLSNTAGTIVATEIRPFDQIVQRYMLSCRLLWPLLPLLITSLFITIIRIRKVFTSSGKPWIVLAVLFYLVLPLGRMLWLSTSVQIPSTIVPPSSLALGAVLTYFPPFAGLATMVLVLASTKGSKSMSRVALLPASTLSLVMLAKLIMTLMILPWLWHSGLYLFSFWNDSLSEFTLFTMLLVMFIAGGTVLIALMRGFVILRTTDTSSQSNMKPSFT